MHKSIIILGANGMLGQMVMKYFIFEKYKVQVINDRFESNTVNDFINKINSYEDSIVINCIGKIKQKSDDLNDLLWSNSILPLELARSLKSGHFLIHPSTDCVFSGNIYGKYLSHSWHDSVDFYGWSKSLGETAVYGRAKSLVIRVSIIGPDTNSNKGLLSWFLNLPNNSEINGYVNHTWNGVTTLEWCKQVQTLIEKKDFEDNLYKLIQLGTEESYSKNDMLNSFQTVFGTNHKITPTISENTINRCLNADIVSKCLQDQLKELQAFLEIK